MKKKIVSVGITSIICLTAVNFIWETSHSHNWGLAAEHSFFQFIAIMAFGVLLSFELDE